MALNMLNITCSLLTLIINSPTATSIKVLSIARNGHPKMSETSLSSSIYNIRKSIGKMNLSTFTLNVFNFSPRKNIVSIS